MRRQLLQAFILLCVTACDPQARNAPMSADQPNVFLQSADPTFHLSPAQRAGMPQQIDADAVEQVLAWTRPEYRDEVLRDLVVPALDPRVMVGPMFGRTGNPAIDQAFGRVYSQAASPPR